MNSLIQQGSEVNHAELNAHFAEAYRHLTAIISMVIDDREEEVSGMGNLMQATYELLVEWSLHAASYSGEESPYPNFCGSCECEPLTTETQVLLSDGLLVCPRCAAKGMRC